MERILLSSEDQLAVPDADHVAAGQELLGHAVPVHVDPVGGAEICQLVAAVDAADAGVLARDRGVSQDDRVAGDRADRRDLLAQLDDVSGERTEDELEPRRGRPAAEVASDRKSVV